MRLVNSAVPSVRAGAVVHAGGSGAPHRGVERLFLKPKSLAKLTKIGEKIVAVGELDLVLEDKP